jgi:predicted  nucleic acid-binding Zn-ribbon protein
MSLSDRIRPNSEAAPWVVNEVRDLEKLKDALEAENEKLKQSLSFYMSELAEAQKRVDELGERLYHITGSYE